MHTTNNPQTSTQSPKTIIVRLGFTSFLNDLSSEMIFPILPLLIEQVGGGGMALGLIGGLRDSASELLKAFFGHLSDKTGNRKLFIYAGYLTSAFFKFFLIIASNWYMILGIIGLERLGKALRTAPRDAFITETLPKNIGKGFGIHRAFDTLGAIVGSLIAFVLVWQWHMPFGIIILIAAVISLFSVIPLMGIQEQTTPTPKATPQISYAVFSPQFTWFTVIATLFSCANVSYMFFIVHAQQALATPSSIIISMLLYVLFNMFYTISAIPFGMLSDAIGRQYMIMAGYFLFAITMFGFMVAHTLCPLIIFFILYGLSLAIIHVNHKAYAADLAPSNLKATALGMFESITGLAMLLSGLVSGIIWETLGHNIVFLYGGILAIIATVLFISIKAKTV